MARARGVRWWLVLALVLALGLGGGYVWMKQSKAAARAAEKVPAGVVVKPVLGRVSTAEPGTVEGPHGFVAPAIDEAQPGEEGEQ